ncbi:MAG TPA: hypothetical protein PLF61_04850, partial [Candidatus Goldiibacteriota bacterium]|nr:hypothetical protein [Candidatus Goldiibacteriota bacterium]
IKITDFMDPSIAPAFVSGVQGPDAAYVWIKHMDYSWKNKSPGEIKGAYININNLNDGRYSCIIIDPESGDKISGEEKLTVNGAIKLYLPAFNKSIAIKTKNLTLKKKKNGK